MARFLIETNPTEARVRKATVYQLKDLKSYDAIVVGGGVVGGATVLELSKYLSSIAWIFPNSKQQVSATYAAGAMLGAFGEIGISDTDSEFDTEFKFRLQAQNIYQQWMSELTELSGLPISQSKGTFIVGNTAGPQDSTVLANIKRYGMNYPSFVETIEPSDVPGLHPTERYHPIGCLYLPNEHALSTSDLLRSLRIAAERSNKVQIIDDVVNQLKQQESNWVVKTSSEREFYSEKLVLCAGASSLDLLPENLLGLTKMPKMFFGKGTSSLVQSSIKLPSTIRTPNRAFACGSHVVPRSGSSIYIGATNFFGSDSSVEAGVEVGELHMLFDQAIHQINTDLRHAKISENNYGFRPITTLREPLVGKTKAEGLYIGTGTYRNGVLMAPLIAKILAAEVINQEFDFVNPYSPESPGDRTSNIEEIIEQGISDIVGILHEPNGVLPYDRSRELGDFMSTLFKMAILSDEYSVQREALLTKIKETPLNETLNRIFYDVISMKNEK